MRYESCLVDLVGMSDLFGNGSWLGCCVSGYPLITDYRFSSLHPIVSTWLFIIQLIYREGRSCEGDWLDAS